MIIQEISEADNGDSDNLNRGEVERNEIQSNGLDKSVKGAFVGVGARFLFYPTLLYNVLRNKYQTEFRWWDEVDKYLLLGAVPFPKDVPVFKEIGVHGVVTLNEPYETLVPTSLYREYGIKHLVIPTRDYMFAPSFDAICQAVSFIYENAVSGKTTYVHCKAGRGRSTTIVLCYLVEHRQMTPTQAYEYVKSKRPRVLLAASQWKAVQEYEKRRKGRLSNLSLSLGSLAEAQLLIPDYMTDKLHAASNMVVERKDVTCDDSIVIVTAADLDGYGEIENTGIIGNELWKEFGMSYRARIIAAKGVMKMFKASETLAKLSCLMVGCESKSESQSKLIHAKSLSTVESCSMSEQLNTMHVTFPVCAQGVVNC